MSTYLIEAPPQLKAPPIFKIRVATELLILSLDVSAQSFQHNSYIYEVKGTEILTQEFGHNFVLEL